MDDIKVERIGGLAGFGQPGGHLKSVGRINLSDLAPKDRLVVEGLFGKVRRRTKSARADGFRFVLTRTLPSGVATVEVAEELVPQVLADCVRDILE